MHTSCNVTPFRVIFLDSLVPKPTPARLPAPAFGPEFKLQATTRYLSSAKDYRVNQDNAKFWPRSCGRSYARSAAKTTLENTFPARKRGLVTMGRHVCENGSAVFESPALVMSPFLFRDRRNFHQLLGGVCSSS